MKSDIPGYGINGGGVLNNIQNHDNLPTYVDGNAWYPTWAGITTSWIDVPSTSDKYINPTPHPTGEWNITSVTNVNARENFQVVEYPSASNDYTAKILIDDIKTSGADWYSFTLTWEAQGATQDNGIFSNPLVLGGVAAGAAVSVGAVAYAVKVLKVGKSLGGSAKPSGSSGPPQPLQGQQGQNPNTPTPNDGNQGGANPNSGSGPNSSQPLQGDGQSAGQQGQNPNTPQPNSGKQQAKKSSKSRGS